MLLQPAQLALDASGTPYSADYGDIYHSASGGPEQARHVFLEGNELPQRWAGRTRFVILETGFGLGLNFLATWAAWANDPQACNRLHFISVEKHPFGPDDLARTHAAWPQFAPQAAELRQHWPPLVPGIHRLHLAGGRLILTLVFGDASEQLRKLEAGVDAFYLDGFSPANNPELWTPRIARALARLAAPGATLATWSVAGQVRQALAEAEFDLEKRPGFAGKRHMLVGRYRARKPNRHPLPTERRALILGAGAAGCAAAHRLAARGWQVTVLEALNAPGQAASGNIAGMLRPLPSVDDNRLARLTRAGFLATRALLPALGDAVRWGACGVLHLARDAEQEALQQRTVATLGFPASFLQFLDAEAASARLGWPVALGGWWFPSAGWVQPPSLCQAALQAFPEHITLRPNTPVASIAQDTNGHWQACDAQGKELDSAPHLVMASGTGATRFTQFAWLPQLAARGQVTHLPTSSTPALDIVVCRGGYATPAVDGRRVIGASFELQRTETDELPSEHQDNLHKLDHILPGFLRAERIPAQLNGRVGFRPVSPDRLPIVGAVPHPENPRGATRLHDLRYPAGLWCVQGFGTRGIAWSALMGELLASRMEGDPLPLENDLVDALAPGRFLLGQRI